MLIRQTIIFAAILAALAVVLPALAAPGPDDRLPNVAPAMEDARYWADKLADKNRLILDKVGIDAFNTAVRQHMPPLVYDLTAYPQALDKKVLTYMLRQAKLPARAVYSGGSPVPASFFTALQEQVNLAGIKDSNDVRYAFAVTRASVRRFPTAQGVFDSPGDSEFDTFQETIVDPAEPLLVLHQSRDGRWYYVQVRNYRGWVAAGDVALALGREVWLAYASRPDFLVVTGKNLRVQVGDDARPLFFAMGARLPLAGGDAARGYRVELPARGGDGTVVFRQVTLPSGADVVRGYLPFTRENLLRQAFKMKGVRYGWGGLYEGVDCSAFVMDVYRTFGILLPRNADQQLAAAGQAEDYRGLTPAAKSKAIRALEPGDALFTAYHVVLYVGGDQSRAYVIHALPAYRDPGSQRKVAVMRVVLSDVSLPLSDGRSLLETLIGSNRFAVD